MPWEIDESGGHGGALLRRTAGGGCPYMVQLRTVVELSAVVWAQNKTPQTQFESWDVC